jgi:hypothetical protein
MTTTYWTGECKHVAGDVTFGKTGARICKQILPFAPESIEFGLVF